MDADFLTANFGSVVGLVLILVTSTSFGGVITALVNARRNKAETKKAGADAVEAVTSAAVLLISPLERKIQNLNDELDKANRKIGELSRSLDESNHRVRELSFEVESLSNQLKVAEGQLDTERRRRFPRNGDL